MGSSSRKNSKSASSKARRRRLKEKSRKRHRDASSPSSHDYSSSSDSENHHRTYKKKLKVVKNRSRRSPGPEDEKLRTKKIQAKQHSRSMERKKVVNKKRKDSGRSYSCSTCSDGSDSSSDEREISRVRKPESRRSRPDEGRRKRRYRSPSSRSSLSCSSCSKSSRESPKQVGSVSPVPKEIKKTKGGQHYKSENNAEIIQSYDDYPSSRSNDSTDVGRIRQTESDGHTKMPTETNETESFVESDNPRVDDLEETLLRQKALENLAKFRFRQQASAKGPGNLKDEDAASGHALTNSRENLTDVMDHTGTEPNNENVWSDEPRKSFRVRSLVVAAKVNKEPTSVESGVEEFPKEPSVAEDTPHEHITDALKPVPLSSSMSTIKANKPNGSTSDSEFVLPPNSETECDAYNNQKGEAGGGSHLQQKTMSVMRGGELVQVTYKVHIPKRAQALAKRRLQR